MMGSKAGAAGEAVALTLLDLVANPSRAADAKAALEALIAARDASEMAKAASDEAARAAGTLRAAADAAIEEAKTAKAKADASLAQLDGERRKMREGFDAERHRLDGIAEQQAAKERDLKAQEDRLKSQEEALTQAREDLSTRTRKVAAQETDAATNLAAAKAAKTEAEDALADIRRRAAAIAAAEK